jgi:hypothetical protein
MAMSDESWEKQFKEFLRKTGEDFRRTGEDIKAEAQRLFDAAMDPDKQQRARDRLNELTLWARKAARGVAGAVEEAASKAETVFLSATDKVTEPTEKVSGTKRTSSSSNASSTAGGAHPAAPGSTAPHKPAATAKKASRAKVKPGKPRQKNGGKRKR